MTTFVLVHGAWGGSWGFRKVRPLLTAAGHDVFTPSLTGIGEREHLATPDVGLKTHVQDVVALIRYEDLHDIVLLGFSYGGMVVTGALAHIGGRVSHLVYLDAFVPKDGETVQALTGIDPTSGGGETPWLLPPIPRELGDAEETEWANERRSGQPVATFTEPVALDRPLEDWPFTRTYVKASADPGEAADSAFYRAAAMAAESPAWQTHEIATNHMIPLMEPDALASILLNRAMSGD